MSDCISNENYDGYVPITVDPGPSMFVFTIFICALLLASLPCLLSITKRFKKHHRAFATRRKEKRKHDTNETTTLDPNAPQNATKHGDDDESSVSSAHSSRTGVSGAASAVLNLILDSGPCGPHPRKNHMLLVQRDQMLEAEERRIRSPLGEEMDSISVSTNGSVLGKLDHDAVSVQDAVDAGPNVFHDSLVKSSDVKARCCSRTYWAIAFDQLLTIAEYDYESKRICKLGTPFIIQGLLGGIAEAVSVALIGRLLGTNALSAYIVVDLVVGVTTQFLKGFQDALVTLCSQSLGVGNKVLTGQYLQMTVIIYTVLYIPIFVFWYYFVVDTILWFGLDQQTADMGQDFAILLLLAFLIHGLDESIHALLDVIGCENYSTVMTVSREIFTTVGVYISASQPNANLQQLGYVYVGVYGIGLVLNVIMVLWNGWFDPFLEGIIGTFALKVSGLFSKLPEKFCSNNLVYLMIRMLKEYGCCVGRLLLCLVATC